MLNNREKIGQDKKKRERALEIHETLTKDLIFVTLEVWVGGRERAEVEKCSKRRNGG